MPPPVFSSAWLVMAAVVALACAPVETASPDLAPTEAAPTEAAPIIAAPLPRPGFFGRQIILTVVNDSDAPARLLVGEDTSPLERVVGNAHPAVVPPHGEALVTFRVPAGRTWAIFVNESGLVLAGDLSRCVGRVDVEIHVEADGGLFWATKADGSCASQE